MAKYIKFNKFNKYFKYVIYVTLFNYFNLCLLGYNYNNSFEEVSLIKFLYYCFKKEYNNNLSNYKITECLLNYFGIFILSIFSRLHELHLSDSKINKFFEINDSDVVAQRKIVYLNLDNNNKKKSILHRFRNYLVVNSSHIIYIVISFFWVVDEIILIIFSTFLSNIDFWFFEILMVSFFYSRIFLIRIYRHQKIAIIINLLPSLLKTATIILSFYSQEQKVYTEYPWWIPIGIFLFLFLKLIEAFIYCTLKSFFDIKYISTSHILMFYSFVGLLICLIICFMSSFFPCSEITDSNYFVEGICTVQDDTYRYLDNILIYFKTYSDGNAIDIVIRTFIIIADSVTFFLYKYFSLLVIKYTDPVNIILCFPMVFIIKKVVLVLINLIINGECFKDTSNYKVDKYFLDIFGDIICLFGYLIYLEIIELKFCGLDHDIKKNIIIRGMSEEFSINDMTGFINDEDMQEDENPNLSYEMQN